MSRMVITRDKNGVLVWKPGTKVELSCLRWWDALDFWSKQSQSDEPVWTSKGFNKLLFNEKQVREWFPELVEHIDVWETKEMEITIG